MELLQQHLLTQAPAILEGKLHFATPAHVGSGRLRAAPSNHCCDGDASGQLEERGAAKPAGARLGLDST